LFYDAPVMIVDKLPVLALAGVVVLSGCSSSPAPAPSSAPPPGPTRAELRVYHATGDLCGRIDRTSLSAVLGPLKSSQAQPGTPGANALTRSCTLRFGSSTPIPVEVSIQLATNGASVAGYYHGLRGVEGRQTQLSTVSGLGQDAYTYEDATGPHLVAFDNNLFLSYAVVMGGLPQSSVPPGVVGAEVASAHATMDNLVR
jgi:hypothetical protein